MFTKDNLVRISHFTESQKLREMSDEQFLLFAKELSSFTEAYPEKELALKVAVSGYDNDKDAIRERLSDISVMLKGILADGLAERFDSVLATVGTADLPEIQAVITNLIAATVALSIDVQMADHADENTQEQKQEAAPSDDAERLVLAVDDAAFFLSTLRNYVKDTKYKLTCVNSGRNALQFINQHRPKLFILDIEMPHMDGFELAKEIRKQGHTAPIIFLTGNADKMSVVRAIKAGGADFIVKPSSKEQVLERIGKHI